MVCIAFAGDLSQGSQQTSADVRPQQPKPLRICIPRPDLTIPGLTAYLKSKSKIIYAVYSSRIQHYNVHLSFAKLEYVFWYKIRKVSLKMSMCYASSFR